jgi:hypothetical protein
MLQEELVYIESQTTAQVFFKHKISCLNKDMR